MRIISKYKDYYDYLAGEYGVDPILVLDRRTVKKSPYISDGNMKLEICDMTIEGLHLNGKSYFGDQLSKFGELIKPKRGNPYYRIQYQTESGGRIETCGTLVHHLLTPNVRKINTKLKCPILLRKNDVFWDTKNIENNYFKFPILYGLGVNKAISAKDMWLMLSAWLGSQIENKPVPVGDDKVRILSHGFDLKTSFRNTK